MSSPPFTRPPNPSRTSSDSSSRRTSYPPSRHSPHNSRDTNAHVPVTPSRLWQSHAPGTLPEATMSASPPHFTHNLQSSPPPLDFAADGIHPFPHNSVPAAQDHATSDPPVAVNEPAPSSKPDAHARLLENYDRKPGCGPAQQCSHGVFSLVGRALPASIASRRTTLVDDSGAAWTAGMWRTMCWGLQ